MLSKDSLDNQTTKQLKDYKTMKKKEYIQPEAKEIKLRLQSVILAGSEQLDPTETITEEEDIASFDAEFEDDF